MCSLSQSDGLDKDGIEGLASQVRIKVSLDNRACKKCGKKGVIVLRGHDVYCTLCLIASVTHKFRSCLGKSRLMKNGEKVLIAYSGGQSSSAMLRLVKDGLDEPSHKKLRFQPVVVYIDEGGLLLRDSKIREEETRKVVSCVQNYDFPVYVSFLEMIMAPENSELFTEVPIDKTPTLKGTDEFEQQLQKLFNSMKNLTAKEDLLLKLRHQLLCRIATQLGCTKVFLGDSETLIAVRVLADISLGKGKHMALNCGFVDDRFSPILFLRPMREILAKEVVFYASTLNLPLVIQPSLATMQSDNSSIQRLTESFIFGLQEKFPGTVSTVFKTGDKMGSTGIPKKSPSVATTRSSSICSEALDLDHCILCSGLIDVNDSVGFSAKESGLEKSTNDNSNECSSDDCICAGGTKKRLTPKQLEKVSCYSCRLILQEMGSIDCLPSEILKKAAFELRRKAMKSQIAEFLLDSSS